MVASGADDKVMANWFPMAMKPAVRSWIMNLPERSVGSWADLCDQFVSAFQGGYKRPGTMNDLHLVIQGPEERMRGFMQRFSQVSHSIPSAAEASMIDAFSRNVRDGKMREKLSTHHVQTAHELYTLADKCALMEEGRLGRSSLSRQHPIQLREKPARRR